MYSSQNSLLLVVMASVGLVTVIMGSLLYAMMRQFRYHQNLQLNSERLRLEALEEERKLLSADLHDDIGPLLSATLLNLDNMEPAHPAKKEQLEESRQHINTIYDRIHDISKMMFPRSIERKGPLHALEEFNSLYKQTSSLDVQIMATSYRELSSFTSLHLFRMLQEILLNTIRHANASTLFITSEMNRGKLLITCCDNGKGFDVNAAMERQSLGLKNLVIRAKMMDAKLKIESESGKGTTYRLEVQLTN